jgi:hypothetical protein
MTEMRPMTAVCSFRSSDLLRLSQPVKHWTDWLFFFSDPPALACQHCIGSSWVEHTLVRA